VRLFAGNGFSEQAHIIAFAEILASGEFRNNAGSDCIFSAFIQGEEELVELGNGRKRAFGELFLAGIELIEEILGESAAASEKIVGSAVVVEEHNDGKIGIPG